MSRHDEIVRDYKDFTLQRIIETLTNGKPKGWEIARLEAARRELARREMERKTQNKK